MENYNNLKQRHQKEFNEFPMFYAFSNEQFNEGMKKIGLDPSETNLVYKTSIGGFYRKTDSHRLKKIIDNHIKEMAEAMEDDDFAYEAINYELGNHEYCITYDTSDALEALGLDPENLDERLKHITRRAADNQLRLAAENGWSYQGLWPLHIRKGRLVMTMEQRKLWSEGQDLWFEYVWLNGYSKTYTQEGVRRLSRLLDLNTSYIEKRLAFYLQH